jgi:hypothetical protein
VEQENLLASPESVTTDPGQRRQAYFDHHGVGFNDNPHQRRMPRRGRLPDRESEFMGCLILPAQLGCR